jgi:hypothetical protein
MVAVPVPTPVTTPAEETVAMVLSLVDHPTIRPGRMFPLASSVKAARFALWPATVATVAGVTVTVATGTGRTVTDADPCLPSTVATMTALPGLNPVTMPDEDTLASDGVLLAHVTVRPVSG